MQTLGEILSGRAVADFSGREREVEALLDLLEKDGPLAAHVHGVTGIGKSSLLAAFAAGASGCGARLVRIDCRTVEPTAQGFLLELSTALGEPLSTVAEAAQRLSSFGETVVIALDTYEVFYLLDTWIRQVFVPALPTNARMVIAGRNPPSSEWRTAPGWRGLFRSLPLGPFSEKEALAYLAMSGIPPEASIRINRLARGQPLALSMAASIVRSDPERAIEETGLHQVIDGLARSYLEAVPDAIMRRALEASSVVRCVTEPLLHTLLPDIAPGGTMERLGALPFVEVRPRWSLHPRRRAQRDRHQPGGARPGHSSWIPARRLGLRAVQAPRCRQRNAVALHGRPPVSDREPGTPGGFLSERRASTRRRAGYARR
jgi:hypothetical protein